MAEAIPGPFRRIVVGLDASRTSLDALAAAADLARRVGAELAGLFVEDENVLRLAAFPFANVMRLPWGASETLDREKAEAQLRALAAGAREALERAASGRRIASSFRIARGSVVAEVLAAVKETDLLVLGAGGHSRSGRGTVGDTARAAADRAQSSVLLLRRGARLGEPVVAVDDGSAASSRAVALARALAAAPGPTLVEVRLGDPLALSAVLVRLAPSLVVVPAGGSFAAGAALEAVLSSGAAVLIVR
jgi:nucleotide-binding universal stress UspA family protein